MFEYFYWSPYLSTKVTFRVSQKSGFVPFYSTARLPGVFCHEWFLGLSSNAARVVFFFASRNCASSLSDVSQPAFARDAADSGMLVLLCVVFMDETSLEELTGGAMVDFNIFFWEDSFNLMGYWAGVGVGLWSSSIILSFGKPFCPRTFWRCLNLPSCQGREVLFFRLIFQRWIVSMDRDCSSIEGKHQVYHVHETILPGCHQRTVTTEVCHCRVGVL